MTMKRNGAWLMALCAAAGFGCTDTSSTQVLTGRVTTQGAIAVRAVTAEAVITAAQVRSDGSFTIAVPVGRNYRLEVMTSSGVRHVLAQQGGALHKLSFDVCQPVDPFDIGGIGGATEPGDPGMGDGGGGGDVPVCNDPTDPNCEPFPPGCDPTTDPSCWPPDCSADGTCPPKCEPGTNCEPPPMCEPGTDPSGMGAPNCAPGCTGPDDPTCQPPPPCTDPDDPYCKCDANGQCPPPDCDATSEMCPPPPPPPCDDPTNPEACQDPCVDDPAQCGCSSEEPNCWPVPEPPQCDENDMCEPNGMTPDHPPGDFGCEDVVAQ